MASVVTQERLPSGVFFSAGQQSPDSNSHSAINGVHLDHDLAPPLIPEFYLDLRTSEASGDRRYFLPLLEVCISTEVSGLFATTRLVQKFSNFSESPLQEIKYLFPLYNGAVIRSFRFWNGQNGHLVGEIKAKDEAKAIYRDAVSRQKVAGLLEEHIPEVFETSLGHVPAQTTVRVEISYVIELKAELESKALFVTFPTSVAPRHGVPPVSLCQSLGSNSHWTPKAGKLDIQVHVSAPVPIQHIQSFSHPISVELGIKGFPTLSKNISHLTSTTSPGFDARKASAFLKDSLGHLEKDFIEYLLL